MTPPEQTTTLCRIIRVGHITSDYYFVIAFQGKRTNLFNLDIIKPNHFKTRVDAILTARDRSYAVVDTFPEIYK